MTNNTQEEKVLEQIEMEVRMRDGASKLLAACSQRQQALEVSKNLVTCNSRILALLSQLQAMRKAEVLQRVENRLSDDIVPCTGKVAISDLRIPLMWKDSEYFKHKGELHRCALFCLLQCGSQIFDTDLQIVDRTLTDICFDEIFIFSDIGPGFQLRVELYSSCVVDEGPLGTRRGSSFGVSAMGPFSGKKIRAAFESAAVCGSTSDGRASPTLTSDPSTLEPKFNLLAHVTLRLKDVREGFKTHDLSLVATEDSPFWLPLYGNVCCRLVAQPQCMLKPALSGQLKVKRRKGLDGWENVFGVLKGKSLDCYQSEEKQKSGPLLVIPIRKDTLICVSEQDPPNFQSVCISTKEEGEDVTYKVSSPTPNDMQRWIGALWQHVYNMGEWRQCCTEHMKLEVSHPKKSITAKQGSLFHEIVTPSSPTEGPVVSSLSAEIHNLLASYYKESS